MGFFTRDIATMDDLFIHTLQDIYYAEQQILKSLPTMIGKIKDQELATALRSHLEETDGHVERLERVFEILGKDASGTDCPAIDGIVDEANGIAGDVADKEVMDAALAAAAQAVEHYEISRYGTLIAWARELGRDDCAQILMTTLNEEKAADKTLTAIAESRLNARAAV